MSKETIMAEVQQAIKDEKIVIGTDRVIKGLKNADLKKVIVTGNAPEFVKEDIAHYAKLASIEVLYDDISNEELKELCKKPFNISVIGIL